jgi:hypothetical protein
VAVLQNRRYICVFHQILSHKNRFSFPKLDLIVLPELNLKYFYTLRMSDILFETHPKASLLAGGIGEILIEFV